MTTTQVFFSRQVCNSPYMQQAPCDLPQQCCSTLKTQYSNPNTQNSTLTRTKAVEPRNTQHSTLTRTQALEPGNTQHSTLNTHQDRGIGAWELVAAHSACLLASAMLICTSLRTRSPCPHQPGCGLTWPRVACPAECAIGAT